MNRDLDLIAVQWVDEPKDDFEMINAMSQYLTGHTSEDKNTFLYGVLPGKRHGYVINLNRGINGQDPQYYIDISVVKT